MRVFALSFFLALFALVYVAQSQPCVKQSCQSCGNGKCEVGETSCSCPRDCPGCCPDHSCRPDHGENHLNCPWDCATNVTVSVVDGRTGAAITGAMVTCSSREEVLGPVSTRSSNSFTFEDQAMGVWSCRADKLGYESNSASALLSPPFSCVATQTVVVPLKYKHACIFGVVVDDFTGVHIPNATVGCVSLTTPGVSLPITNTDVNGKWFHDLVVSGNWRCTATAPGYLPGNTTQTYDFDEKKEHKVPLRAVPGRAIGTVTDSKNGTSLFAAITCVDVEGKVYTLPNHWNFSYAPLRPGAFRCHAYKHGFYPATDSGVVPPGGLLVLNLTLIEWYGNLRGRVIDGYTGDPISNARVMCESVCKDHGYDLTSITGDYFIGGLKEGPYMCMVTHLGYQDGWLSQFVYINQTSTLNFVLLPLETVVKGKIHRFDIVPGAPIPNANIVCYARDRMRQQVIRNVSDSRGNYRIGEFYGSGEMTCVVSAAGFQTSSRTFKYRWEEQIDYDISLPVN